MSKITSQMNCWMGKFGTDYTERNSLSLKELDNLYKKNYGINRTELNKNFLKNIITDSSRILEVGSNIGNQLLLLQKMGFGNLYGIEIQNHAVELSKQRTKGINLIQGSAFDIPFKDGFFDLVFTSGVLIHISPGDIKDALKEIYRCTKKYIWGFESYEDNYTEVLYRGNNELYWKTDFAKLYIETFDDLVLVKEKKMEISGSDNIDVIFLLEKMR